VCLVVDAANPVPDMLKKNDAVALVEPLKAIPDVVKSTPLVTPFVLSFLELGKATPTTRNPCADDECIKVSAPGILYPPS